MLPPPTSIESPSLEGGCDIVLPPPAESLYTLPRKKHTTTSEFETQNNGDDKEQEGKLLVDNKDLVSSGGTGAFANTFGNRNGRMVRFEPGSTSPNISLRLQVPSSPKTSSSNSSAESCNKKSTTATTSGSTHSESAV